MEKNYSTIVRGSYFISYYGCVNMLISMTICLILNDYFLAHIDHIKLQYSFFNAIGHSLLTFGCTSLILTQTITPSLLEAINTHASPF